MEHPTVVFIDGISAIAAHNGVASLKTFCFPAGDQKSTVAGGVDRLNYVSQLL